MFCTSLNYLFLSLSVKAILGCTIPVFDVFIQKVFSFITFHWKKKKIFWRSASKKNVTGSLGCYIMYYSYTIHLLHLTPSVGDRYESASLFLMSTISYQVLLTLSGCSLHTTLQDCWFLYFTTEFSPSMRGLIIQPWQALLFASVEELWL